MKGVVGLRRDKKEIRSKREEKEEIKEDSKPLEGQRPPEKKRLSNLKKGAAGLRTKKKGDSQTLGGSCDEDPNKVYAKNKNILGQPGRLKIIAQSSCLQSALPTPSPASEQGTIGQGPAL